jgi:hypothetical protein
VTDTTTRTVRPKDEDGYLPQYTVGVVAERLGVPIATLRSWNQRYGIGPSNHSPGRHRLYSELDIRIVEQMHKLVASGASPSSAARVALDAIFPVRGDTKSLLRAAFSLDVAGVGGQIERHLRQAGVVDTWDQLIRPVYATIEATQADGEGCIDVEHALSWAVSRSLHRLPGRLASHSAPVILACTAGETHTLALEALRAALGERGHGALMLGADVPTSALIDAIGRRPRPAQVVLWSQAPDTADVGTAWAVVAEKARLIIGGPGWASAKLPKKAVRVDSLQGALQAVAETA